MTFRDLGFNEQLIEGLEYMNFVEATPIQAQAIPLIQEGRDLIACAQTGTGKTGAFLLPLINKLSERKTATNGNVDVLIIVPTRELALQIDQQVEAFGYFSGVSSIPIYGGGDNTSYQQQKKALIKGADIIIATPGRLLSHINLGYVKLENVKHFILDEADRMMDMGFFDDIMTVVNKLPKDRQTLFFSATMPDNIRKLSQRVLNNPEQINIALSKPAKGVTQGAFMCYSKQKVALAVSILDGEGQDLYPSVIIFTSTKRKVSEIHQSLSRKKIKSEMISSDLDQKEREAALIKFKNRDIQVLVATDILARGIDIKEISLVINYDVPGDAEDYVHRIGRTARADSTGTAYTFITEDDQDKFFKIEKLIEATIDKLPLPKEIGEGPEYKPGTRRRGGGNYRRNGGGGNRNRNNRGGGGNRNNRSRGPKGQGNNRGGNRNSNQGRKPGGNTGNNKSNNTTK